MTNGREAMGERGVSAVRGQEKHEAVFLHDWNDAETESRAAGSECFEERNEDCPGNEYGRVIVRSIRFTILAACVPMLIGILAGPVNAGDYYDSGHRRDWRSAGVSYSTDCCYRKIIRHWRSVRYERVYESPRRRHHHGESHSPYRYSDDYYGPRRYVSESYSAPRRYVSDTYYAPRRYVSENYYGQPRYAAYRSYGDDCQLRRLWDGRGGWVWAIRRGCQ